MFVFVVNEQLHDFANFQCQLFNFNLCCLSFPTTPTLEMRFSLMCQTSKVRLKKSGLTRHSLQNLLVDSRPGCLRQWQLRCIRNIPCMHTFTASFQWLLWDYSADTAVPNLGDSGVEGPMSADVPAMLQGVVPLPAFLHMHTTVLMSTPTVMPVPMLAPMAMLVPTPVSAPTAMHAPAPMTVLMHMLMPTPTPMPMPMPMPVPTPMPTPVPTPGLMPLVASAAVPAPTAIQAGSADSDIVWPMDTELIYVPGMNKLMLTMQSPVMQMVIHDAFQHILASLLLNCAFPDALVIPSVVRDALIVGAWSNVPRALNIHSRLLADGEYVAEMSHLVSPFTSPIQHD